MLVPLGAGSAFLWLVAAGLQGLWLMKSVSTTPRDHSEIVLFSVNWFGFGFACFFAYPSQPLPSFPRFFFSPFLNSFPFYNPRSVSCWESAPHENYSATEHWQGSSVFGQIPNIEVLSLATRHQPYIVPSRLQHTPWAFTTSSPEPTETIT